MLEHAPSGDDDRQVQRKRRDADRGPRVRSCFAGRLKKELPDGIQHRSCVCAAPFGLHESTHGRPTHDAIEVTDGSVDCAQDGEHRRDGGPLRGLCLDLVGDPTERSFWTPIDTTAPWPETWHRSARIRTHWNGISTPAGRMAVIEASDRDQRGVARPTWAVNVATCAGRGNVARRSRSRMDRLADRRDDRPARHRARRWGCHS